MRTVGQAVYSVAFRLLPALTGIGLIGMPSVVGAHWPGWTSAMLLVVLVALPAAVVLVLISHGAARAGRWVVAVAIAAVLVKVVWTLAEVGPVLLVAAVPMLLGLLAAVLLLVYSWPRATSRELAEFAHANGWQASRELPGGGTPASPSFPVLPLSVGRFWVIRNVIQAAAGSAGSWWAFELRWLEFHGLVCRRRRLAVFVAPRLPVALPFFEVRPGSGVTRSDLTLESLEFNRSFDVLGEDPRYLMAVLHPRTMQALLDARPIGFTIAGDAMIGYDSTGLTPESLQRGFGALSRVFVPAHVLEDWGRPAPSPRPGLRFAVPTAAPTIGTQIARVTALCTGILGLTLLTTLAAAALEASTGRAPFDPAQPVSSLVAAVVGLLAVATGCAAYGRRRPAYGARSVSGEGFTLLS